MAVSSFYTRDHVLLALRLMGSPQDRLKNVVHVAGTNGKGSTVMFLRTILRECGYSCNAFTSPHLTSLGERIVVCGQEMGDSEFEDLASRVRGEMSETKEGRECLERLSYFEELVLLSYVKFAESGADVNLIEVGLGGLLDATNVLPGENVVVLTSVSYDHMAILGSTIESITENKIRIAKPGSFVVVAKQGYPQVVPEAVRWLDEIGVPKEKRFFYGSQNPDISEYGFEVDGGLGRGTVRIFGSLSDSFGAICDEREVGQGAVCGLLPAMVGGHQMDNVASAVVCAGILRAHYGMDEIVTDGIRRGVAAAVNPGRFQALPGGRVRRELLECLRVARGDGLVSLGFENLFIDAAHNEGSFVALLEVLRQGKISALKAGDFSGFWMDGSSEDVGEPGALPRAGRCKMGLVFGALDTKDIAAIARVVVSANAEWRKFLDKHCNGGGLEIEGVRVSRIGGLSDGKVDSEGGDGFDYLLRGCGAESWGPAEVLMTGNLIDSIYCVPIDGEEGSRDPVELAEMFVFEGFTGKVKSFDGIDKWVFDAVDDGCTELVASGSFYMLDRLLRWNSRED